MTVDRIERDIHIAARPERVWRLVAEPGFWASDEAGIRGTTSAVGESFVAHHSEAGDFPMRTVAADPPRYLAYRWVSAFPGEELREDNSTLVEFTLTPEGDGTRLHVVESGFAGLPTDEANRQNVIDDHTGGWEGCFSTLVARAEEPHP
jgi:uncharacterized protein YndB with AHSA1/START domain